MHPLHCLYSLTNFSEQCSLVNSYLVHLQSYQTWWSYLFSSPMWLTSLHPSVLLYILLISLTHNSCDSHSLSALFFLFHNFFPGEGMDIVSEALPTKITRPTLLPCMNGSLWSLCYMMVIIVF